MKSVSVTNNKGGVGKTLISFNIMCLLATKFEKRVLVIDNDAQHNMSNILFKIPKKSNKKFYTTNDIYLDTEVDINKLINKTHIKNLDIISSTIRLTETEILVNSFSGRELIIKNWLEDNKEFLNEHYDYVFFDCNPSMNTLNINCFYTSDSIILITDIDFDGLEGIEMFMELYYPIRIRLDRNANDNVKGLIVNKLNESTKMGKDFLEYVKSSEFAFNDLLFDNMIHNAVALSETKGTREGITKGRNERGYNEIYKLIEEMIDKGVL